MYYPLQPHDWTSGFLVPLPFTSCRYVVPPRAGLNVILRPRLRPGCLAFAFFFAAPHTVGRATRVTTTTGSRFTAFGSDYASWTLPPRCLVRIRRTYLRTIRFCDHASSPVGFMPHTVPLRLPGFSGSCSWVLDHHSPAPLYVYAAHSTTYCNTRRRT